ncbi:hypothetical protein T265_07102 [Opisthorchis viverrini]|uniref:Uncharacterized protein n=1 Tax=Opisthorchis viverrini TaxID=6198 RepID=A0A074ZQ10_OPIVI|nr:hypothetical protein T265_07102 [Opisthorchis viverrini]KER25420.1 hypothetical protein T265_07102 [Opisthorchis viverrini]
MKNFRKTSQLISFYKSANQMSFRKRSDCSKEALMVSVPHVYVDGAKWLEFTDRKFHVSNPTSASRLPLSELRQPRSIPALEFPSDGMVARHRKDVTAERLRLFITCLRLMIWWLIRWMQFPSTLRFTVEPNRAAFDKETHLRVAENSSTAHERREFHAIWFRVEQKVDGNSRLCLPYEPQEGRNRSWTVEEFSAIL